MWIEVPVAALLAVSGLFALASAIGLVRFKTFLQRLHPPALAFTCAAWCVTLASVLYFSALGHKLALHAWLIVIFMFMTVPVTATLLARTELFRKRTGGHGADVPLALSLASEAEFTSDARPAS